MILPTITTIAPGAWRMKIAELNKFKLRAVCLFLTCLNAEERKELYSLLAQTPVKSVPLVHIKNDMTIRELEFLEKKYGTNLFNTHSPREFPPIYDYGHYKKNICIENNQYPFDEQEIKEFGGTCLDISHLENDRLLKPEAYQANIKILAKYPPRCSHVAAIKKEPKFSTHHLADLSELDYLRRYPKEYFGQVSAIELENSIQEQLAAIKYIKTAMKS